MIRTLIRLIQALYELHKWEAQTLPMHEEFFSAGPPRTTAVYDQELDDDSHDWDWPVAPPTCTDLVPAGDWVDADWQLYSESIEYHEACYNARRQREGWA